MMVSAGAGTFNNESAVSVGASFNAGIHTVIKAEVSRRHNLISARVSAWGIRSNFNSNFYYNSK